MFWMTLIMDKIGAAGMPNRRRQVYATEWTMRSKQPLASLEQMAMALRRNRESSQTRVELRLVLLARWHCRPPACSGAIQLLVSAFHIPSRLSFLLFMLKSASMRRIVQSLCARVSPEAFRSITSTPLYHRGRAVPVE
jgi:hypothetical protein